jgi:hypothetical protein
MTLVRADALQWNPIHIDPEKRFWKDLGTYGDGELTMA